LRAAPGRVETAVVPLLERESVLISLREYLQSARNREGRLAFVAGEAGVGKTAVVDAFARSATDIQWGHGVCDGLFTPRPLGPLFDLAADLGGPISEACRRGAPRDELFGALLQQLAGSASVIGLWIEDAHWADEATLDLLSFLGRRIGRLPVLVVVTYRDDDLAADHRLRWVIGELSVQGSTRRVDVAPLSRTAVRELAKDSAVDAAELYRLTAGNPFFVAEVLQAGATGVPASARAAVLARTARLSRAARHAVQAAALVGPSVDLALLDAVTGSSAEDLDDLVDAGLLVSDQGGLRFRHEITRLAIECEIPAHRRRPMHAALLAAHISSGCGDEARLAYHAEGAGDAEAVRRLAPAAAARASSLGSHREAAAQYERAIRFADERDPAALADLYDRLAREHALTATWAGAADAGQRALALWRELGDRRRAGAALCWIGQALYRLCLPERDKYAEDAVAMLEPLGPSPELAWAYAIEARVLLMRDAAYERGVQAARSAQGLALDIGLPEVLSDALNTQACITSRQGGEWLPLMERALDVAIEAAAHDQAGRAYANMCALLLEHGNLLDCEKVLEDGIEYCDRQDIKTWTYWLRAHQASSRLSQGRYDAAIEVAAPLLAVPVSSPLNRAMLTVTVGRIHARRGNPEAWRYLDEAVTSAARAGDAEWIAHAYPARAEAHWLASDIEAARRDLAVTLDRLGHTPPHISGPVLLWCRRVGMETPPLAPHADAATMLQLSGDFAAAAAGWDARQMPFDAALAWYDSGTAHGLREAFRRFQALGAVAAADATRRQMRRLGVRPVPTGPRTATQTHPLGLTRREAEILGLLSAAHSNAEIAKQLVLSERTVEHHVSAVLAKLGVRSRSDATRKAARIGPIGGEEN
jgi:DNA-binding CsgD family transcriptional regulator/tetratricopeptide (TPR) repeat protein